MGKEPALPLKVWIASRLLRLRAMTSALPTGLVALVTLPRTRRKAGRGTSDCAGTARITMADAIAIARSLRMVSLLTIPASESKESRAASQMRKRQDSVRISHGRWDGASRRVGSPGEPCDRIRRHRHQRPEQFSGDEHRPRGRCFPDVCP